jgi:predicted O-linked N-acetylglucosamine transferase (SPINDLY family)
MNDGVATPVPAPPGPTDAEALFRSALALHKRGQLAAAEALYRQVCGFSPCHAQALHHLGLIALQTERTLDALQFIGAALGIVGTDPRMHIHLARALSQAGRAEEALARLDRAGALDPQIDTTWIDRGNVLLELARPAEALASFERALALDPSRDCALNGAGNALLDLDRAAHALPYFSRATQRSPATPVYWLNRALAHARLQQPADALHDCQRARALGHATAQLHFIAGNALLDLGRAAEAIDAFDRALQLDPGFSRAVHNRGSALAALGLRELALADFDRCLTLIGRSTPPSQLELDARFNRCTMLTDLSRRLEAWEALEELFTLAPDRRFVRGLLLHQRLVHCHWESYGDWVALIADAIDRGTPADAPFSFLAISDSPAAQLRCARLFAATTATPRCDTPSREFRRRDGRLRIAYLSADFREHPVAQLLAGVIEAHDRSRFETYAISVGPDDGSELRGRMERGFEHFVDAAAMQDATIAATMRELSIDIAVDLNGYTSGSRWPVLAMRPAPIQIAFLGYPGTLGADFIDYLVADRHVIPDAEREHYSEQLIYMPDSYLPGDRAPAAVAPPSRRQAGLPPSGLVLCCFNAALKYSPPMFDVWMRILAAVPGSVIWLQHQPDLVRQNLENEAARRGVVPARLVFASRVPTLAEHRARLGLADLFLDTHPYNAHTTAIDALAAGVPIVTLRGNTFAARVATSLLHAVDCGRLSVATAADYERLAIDLATEPQALADLKAHLRRVRASAPFDPARFCRHLEAAYTATWGLHERGERPAPIWVERVP